MKFLKIITLIIAIFIGITLLYYFLGIAFFTWLSSPSRNGAVIINEGLSNQYYYKEDKVVFVSDANFFSLGARDIEHSDVESFEVLAYNLAKDKNNVYQDERILSGANPKTFELISGITVDEKYTAYYYFKDDTHVFHYNKPIENADPATFKYLWGDYSKDSTFLFFENTALQKITEPPLPVEKDSNGKYLKTSMAVYYKNEQIEGVHAPSFNLIKGAFSEDRNFVYFGSKKLESVDKKSFKVINEAYQKDKNHLYYETKPIVGSDPSSYTFINSYFSKDKNNLYHFGRIVMNANAVDYNSKKIDELSNDYSIRQLMYDDEHTVFVKKNELKEISAVHSIYNNEVYAFNKRIPNADVETFKVFENGEDRYAFDKNNIFYLSSVIENADINSFTIINSDYSKDKNHVYFLENKVPDVNPETFKFQEIVD